MSNTVGRASRPVLFEQLLASKMAEISTDEFEKIPAKIRSVMLGAGVRKADQAKILAEVIGVSVPQAYKKLNGKSDMTLAQIDAFNLRFEVRLLSTPLALLQNAQHAQSTGVHRAILRVGAVELRCTVELGQSGIGESYSKRYAAYQANGSWFVEELAHCPVRGRHEVEHLSIVLEGTEPNIAVLDDEQPTADLLRDYLIKKGFKATAFYSLYLAKGAIQKTHFDGYFLDWRLGDETSEELIKFIRQRQPRAPIIVSTAGVDIPGRRSIYEALEEHYQVEFHIKPNSMKVLTSRMAEAIERKENK